MELDILPNNENKLLNRREIRFRVVHDGGTVKRIDVARELCKKLNLHPDSTIIVRIDQGFGRKESSGTAHSYDSKELMDRYESRNMLEKTSKRAEKQTKAKNEDQKPKPENGDKTS